MAEKITIARPYARAVFAEAKAKGTMQLWQPVLEALAMIASGIVAKHLQDDPELGADRLENLFMDVLSGVVSVDSKIKEQVANFVHLLIFEKRIDVLPEIHHIFHEMLMAAADQMEVDVYAPSALSQQQQVALVNALERRFNATVSIAYHEDKSLIGGMVIRAGNWVMDGSVKGKLTRLAESLI